MTTADAQPGAQPPKPQRVERRVPEPHEFVEMQASPEFQELRKKLRNFVFPVSIFFLVWYTIYVLLGAYANDFMGTPVFGNINVGILLGLAQFVTTFVITGIYVKFANRELDPRAAKIREELEGPLQ